MESVTAEPRPQITEKQIEAEINRNVRPHPEKGLTGYMNNFFMNLPVSDGFPAEYAAANHQLDFRIRNISRRRIGGSVLTEGMDSKLQNKTWEDFFADVDAAIEKTGADRERLLAIQSMIANRHVDRSKLVLEIDVLAKPVYIALRVMGYSHMFLTA